MDPVLVGTIAFVAFMIIIFVGLPVPIAMLASGVIGLAIIKSPAAAFTAVSSEIFQNFASYTLSVAPIFGLMGFLASYTGIGESLFNVADKFIGHKRGGIASAVQVACAAFGAICGSIPATMGTMVTVAYPEMVKRKYNVGLASGAIASGSSLAVLIPPSAMLIIYGVIAEESIGRLFIAGIIPGIVLMVIQVVTIWIVVKRNPEYAPLSEKASWAERWHALRHGGLVQIVIVFLLTLGGMFLGWFTPTEAASIGSVAVLVIGLVERKITFKNLSKSLVASAKLAAMVFFMISCGNIFGRMFALSMIPSALSSWVATLAVPSWVIMGLILLVYFILGFPIDGMPLIILTVPIFGPILANMGYDGIWFGILMVLIICCAGLTPPVGLNCFYMKGFCPEIPLSVIFKGIWPFVWALMISMVIIVIFPSLCTWLPTLLYGN